MLGVPADLKRIKEICDKKITLIEDTAWGCGGKFKNKFLGTWGHMGTFSLILQEYNNWRRWNDIIQE